MTEPIEIVGTIFGIGIALIIIFLTIFYIVKYIVKKRSQKERDSRNKEIENNIKKIEEKITNLKNKKQEILNPVLNSKCSYFHSILNNEVPLIEWELLPEDNDTAESFKIKSAIYKEVQKNFYSAGIYKDFNDFVENIATKCIKKKLKLTKFINKTQTHCTSGRYAETSGDTAVGVGFGLNGNIYPTLIKTAGYSTYIPGTTTTTTYIEEVDETFEDMKNHILYYYNMMVWNVAEYLVEDILPFLQEFFPKASKIDLWHSLFDYENYKKIYGLKEKISALYLEKNSNIDFTYQINKLKEEIKLYKTMKR